MEQGGEPLEDLLPTAEVRPSLEESVPGVAHLGDDTTRPCEECAYLSPQSLGLLEVAEYDSEGLTPGRTELLTDDTHQLGEGLDVLGRGHTRPGQFLDLSDLLLGVTHGCELLVGVLPRHLLESLHHDLLGQPSLLEGEPERPVLGDHLVDALAVDLGGLNKLVLELLGGDACVLQGHPVLKLDRTSGHGLRKLIHRPRGGLGVGTSDRSPVRKTLNRCDRVVQTDTGSGELTDIRRHLTEVVDGLVRIGVQLVQCRVHGLYRLALLGGVGQDGLNRVELELVLLHTIDKWLNGEAREHRGADLGDLAADTGECTERDRLKSRESARSLGDTRLGLREIEVLGGRGDLIDPLDASAKCQSLLELLDSVEGVLNPVHELAVVELERDHPLLDGRH